MNWKYKAMLQFAFSTVPAGEHLNHFFQKHVTKKLPMDDAEFVSRVAGTKAHLDALRQYGHRPIEESTFYEFGAGWDMIPPLSFYALGVERQILIDIRALLKLDLVNDTIGKFQRLTIDFPLARKPERFLTSKQDALRVLKECYRIEYIAPCDARGTGMEAGSIDYITSTNTMEHIPPRDIEAILRECYRLLPGGGVMSFRTDYKDHSSYFDKSVSAYNFLQFSDDAWTRYNPPLNYQNRLRHRDYLQMFQAAGFEIVEDRPIHGSAADLETIQRLPLDTRFQPYTPAELAVRGAKVVLRKPRAS